MYLKYLLVISILWNFISLKSVIECHPSDINHILLSESEAPPLYITNQYHLLEETLLPIILSKRNSNTVILPISSLGLANRLRIIASIYSLLAYQYSTTINYDKSYSSNHDIQINLIVIWITSIECPALFSDLIQSISLPMVTIISMYEIDVPNFNYVLRQYFLPHMNIQYGSTYKEYYYTKFLLLPNTSYIEWRQHNINIIWTRGSHSSIDINCIEYLTLKSTFYRSLIPSNQVQQILNNFSFVSSSDSINKGTNELLVGIHIRAFDNRYDWAVVHPIQSKAIVRMMPYHHNASTNYGNNSDTIDKYWSYSIVEILHNESNESTAVHMTDNDDDQLESGSDNNLKQQPPIQSVKRFDEIQSLDIFITYMEHVIQHHPTVRFFVASNSLEVKQIIQDRFSIERIYTVSSTITLNALEDRSTVNGMIAATAEFFLLSQSAWIAHTMGSSFAREAGCIQQVPVIDVTLWQRTTPRNNALVTIKTDYTGVYFYSQNVQLPYCNMPEYIRDITYERYNFHLTQNNTNNQKYYDNECRNKDSVSDDLLYHSSTTSDASTHVFQVYKVEQPVTTAFNDGNDGKISIFENIYQIPLESHQYCNTNTSTATGLSPVCYKDPDSTRQMCTMPYLICPCRDIITYKNLASNLYTAQNIQQYNGLYCYLDINTDNDLTSFSFSANTAYMRKRNQHATNHPFTADNLDDGTAGADTSRTDIYMDCYILLAESNGYSL